MGKTEITFLIITICVSSLLLCIFLTKTLKQKPNKEKKERRFTKTMQKKLLVFSPKDLKKFPISSKSANEWCCDFGRFGKIN